MTELAEIQPEVKKGRKSWQPFRLLNVHGRNPNLNYRWVEKDANKIERRQHDGYEFVNSSTAAPVEAPASDGLGSAKVVRDLVLMAAPKEIAEDRSAYYKKLADDYVENIHRKDRPVRGLTGTVKIERIS